jgi:hypothetical protein
MKAVVYSNDLLDGKEDQRGGTGVDDLEVVSFLRGWSPKMLTVVLGSLGDNYEVTGSDILLLAGNDSLGSTGSEDEVLVNVVDLMISLRH